MISESLHSTKDHFYLAYTPPYPDLIYITSSQGYSEAKCCNPWTCQWSNLIWRSRIGLHKVSYFIQHDTQRWIQDHQVTVRELPLALIVPLAITPNSFICCIGIVTLICGGHHQMLSSIIIILHSTWYQVYWKAPLPANDFQAMSKHANRMTFPKTVKVHFKYSPLHSSQNMWSNPQVNLLPSWAAWKHSSHFVNILKLYFSKSSFYYPWVTPK